MPITKTKEERRGEAAAAKSAPQVSEIPAVATPDVDKSIMALGVRKIMANGEGAITGLNRKGVYYVIEVTPDTEAQELPQAVKSEDEDNLYIRKSIMLQAVTKVPKMSAK